MNRFSGEGLDGEHNIGELVLEALLSFNIDSISNLNLGRNYSWFDRIGDVDLLTELI